MTSETFNIPTANLSKLHERIEKLNKRAAKIGVEPIKVEVGVRQLEAGEQGEREVFPVTITGKAPKIDGWQFVATLEHDDDGTIIRRIPTFEEDVDLSKYRDATPENCDHCGYKRKRNDTYIVAKRHMMGSQEGRPQTKQVGSNCLKDFTGHESPQAIARFLERVREVLDDLRGGHYSEGGFVPRYSTREYLAHVIWAARHFGWTSKRDEWENEGRKVSTARVAENNMLGLKAPNPLPLHEEPSEGDYTWADKVIAWAENLDVPEDGDDFLHNVHVALRNGSLTVRQFGIAAGALPAYKRALKDTFVGEPGERVSLTLTVDLLFPHDEYTTYVLSDKVGRHYKWSTSTKLGRGQTITGSFRVRDHVENKYGKTTLIHYPKDLEIS